MAGKAERALVTGTDNVYNLQKYRALKLVENYRGEFPNMTEFDESINAGHHADWTEAQYDAVNSKIDLNLLDHHARMIKATNRIKARRDFIDGHSTDS